MSNRVELRNWLLAFAAKAVTVVLCVAYVDRPVAHFFHQHLRRSASWIWIDCILAPLNLVVPLALLSLAGCGIWAKSGHSPRSWTRTPVLCSWATVWAALATESFKHILGRGSPDPLFVQDHLYGFRFLDGGSHWHSFPSGTAAISTAILVVLWILQPRWRTVGAAIVALLCITVVVTNYHWVGDVIAGVFLGTLIGRMTVRPAGKDES